MVWTCGLSEGNVGEHQVQGELGGKRSRGRPVVGQCKGMEKVSLNEIWRVPCGLEKACQLCSLNGLNSPWHSRLLKDVA